MRYITFTPPGEEISRVGVLTGENEVVSLSGVEGLPADMLALIAGGQEIWDKAKYLALSLSPSHSIDSVRLHTPLLRPNSLRDFYAFEQHVATANANRGREVPEAWYQIPVFYFSNPHAAYGHGEDVPMPKYTQALDFELEAAAVIGKPGRDIAAADALEHIFGFTIFNDWSARDEQRKEMSVGLGPAKAKDFASSFGPYIITPDELQDRSDGRPGVYDLTMNARINGEETSRGNWKDLHYSFGEMIARASADVTLYPGDIIGSGTVGSGCLLELTKAQGPWLQKGDIVELEIERLGTLQNKVI